MYKDSTIIIIESILFYRNDACCLPRLEENSRAARLDRCRIPSKRDWRKTGKGWGAYWNAQVSVEKGHRHNQRVCCLMVAFPWMQVREPPFERVHKRSQRFWPPFFYSLDRDRPRKKGKRLKLTEKFHEANADDSSESHRQPQDWTGSSRCHALCHKGVQRPALASSGRISKHRWSHRYS